MTLAADLSSDIDLFFNTSEFAETVVYGSTSISAIVERDHAGPSGVHASLTVKTSDVSDPQYRDQVTIDGETYRVTKGDGEIIKEATQHTVTLFLSKGAKAVVK